MSAIESLHQALRPALRDLTAHELRAVLRGLEPTLEARPKRRTQIVLRRLRFTQDVDPPVIFPFTRGSTSCVRATTRASLRCSS